MKENQILFPQDLYSRYLSNINNIHFTNREIDVISCLLSARKTSKIAFFLSIDPRTVQTHIRNIMLKLECNSRERIIDFIEASDKIPFLRYYYSLLKINAIFEKSLKDISKSNPEKLPVYLLNHRNDKDSLISYFASHLKLAGIDVSIGAHKKGAGYRIYILPKTLTEEEVSHYLQKLTKDSNKILFLLQPRKHHKDIPKELMNFEVIDFAKQENYYFSFFLILKKILPNLNSDKIVVEFKEKYKKIFPEAQFSQVSLDEKKIEKPFVYPIKGYLLSAFLFIGLMSSAFLTFHLSKKEPQAPLFRSDLIIPTESVLLNRPELITQIDEKLKKEGGIQTIALVGPGGAGKTTLARQYAHMQKTSIIWEINAETRENLNRSFEKLAQTLAKAEVDQRVLRAIQETKDLTEKEERIIQFVKERLKSKTNWLLIYDNMESFTDIQKYFPHDSDTWGQGKIILTTRDNNIQNNRHVNYALLIRELTPPQKLNLFKKIMTNGNVPSFGDAQFKGGKQFLENIPPFPLDVSVAAYYIKTTNISYKKYLENLVKNNKDFVDIQENLLKESGDYAKTRYSIISLSLRHLINTHKDFQDLLLLISLLDSQNIPIDLLNKYKTNVIVDNFIYNLKKYSLITTQTTFASVVSTFSIHRSTQAISLDYLTGLLDLEKNKKHLQPILKILEIYIADIIEKESFSQLKFLIRHFEIFLTHNKLLNNSAKGIVGTALGCMYYHLNYYKEAKNTLKEYLLTINKYNKENYILIAKSLLYLGMVEREQGRPEIALNFLNQSLRIYEKFSSKNSLEATKNLTYLGIIYRDLGDIEKAKKLIEQSLMIYEKYYENHIGMTQPLTILGLIYIERGQYEKGKNLIEKSLILYRKSSENHLGIARALTYLGEAYWKLGNYKKAKNLLEQSFLIYKKNISENHAGAGWTLAILGSVHIDIGHYKKGIKIIEQSLAIYKQHFSEDHAAIGWALSSLSSAYKGLKNYKKAKNLLEHAILIFRKEYGEDNIWMFWALEKLGEAFKDLGNYKQAHHIFRKCLPTYEKYYGKDHIETAEVLKSFGQVYLLKDQLELSENFLLKALKIFKLKEHPKSYLILEELSKLYLKKSLKAANEHKLYQSKIFKSQSINYLKQASAIVKISFPEDSSHLRRIQSRLTRLEQE